LLFHESTFLETEKPRAKETAHSTAKDAATIALKASVGKLIIGHFSARYDNEGLFEEEAQRIFINTHAVREGETITVESKNAGLHS
jgi:ribonuclease Z